MVEVCILFGILIVDDVDENGNIILINDIVWVIEGLLFVGEDKVNSVNLVIEEGIIIFGCSGGDYLVVSCDFIIEVVGIVDVFIIFIFY